jgi:hypothetical protein
MGEQQRKLAAGGQSFDPETAPRFSVKIQFYGKSDPEVLDRKLVVNVKDGLLIIADEFTTKVIQMSAIESYEFTKI